MTYGRSLSFCVGFFLCLQPFSIEAKDLTAAPQVAASTLPPLTARTPASTVFSGGSLEIVSPWLRATPGGAKVAGGYLTITNKGDASDHLISAAIPSSARGEVHEMNMDNGTMHMRALADGLEIKPGETITLKPGSYHLMFEDLSAPLNRGDRIEGTLTFAKAGKVSIMFKVGGIADTAPPVDASPELTPAH